MVVRRGSAVESAFQLVVRSLPCEFFDELQSAKPTSERASNGRQVAFIERRIARYRGDALVRRVALLGDVGATGHVMSMAPSTLRSAAISVRLICTGLVPARPSHNGRSVRRELFSRRWCPSGGGRCATRSRVDPTRNRRSTWSSNRTRS